MKNKNKKRFIILALLLIITTGCTKTLTDKNNKAVTNKVTGQNLTENILCRPKDKETIKQYEKNKVNLKKLPECENFKINEGKYEGLWTTFLVKPLAFFILQLGKLTKNYALAVILITLIIRLICYPFTRKTAMQSELMKKAQPEMQRIQKKYAGKQDEQSMMMQSQEMLAIYKKYNISPASGCLFSLIQLPLFLAFYESVQRIPAIFEDTFLGLQLGTTPTVGFTTPTFYMYIVIMILISLSTYYSFKMNMSGQTLDPAMKNMPIYMSIMIIVTALFMPSALCIYWLVSNLCTIFQNIAVKKNKVDKKRS